MTKNPFDGKSVGASRSYDVGTGDRYDTGPRPGGETPPPPDLLADGYYYQNGIVEAAPHEGQGWLPAEFPVTSSGAEITVLYVEAAGFNPATVDMGATYNQNLTDAFRVWDGAEYDTITDESSGTWAGHLSYSSATRTAIFTGAPEVQAMTVEFTASSIEGGNLRIDSFGVNVP